MDTRQRPTPDQVAEATKYNDLVVQLLGQLKAQGVVLLILGGEKGTGAAMAVGADAAGHVAPLLRKMADSLDNEWLRAGQVPSEN